MPVSYNITLSIISCPTSFTFIHFHARTLTTRIEYLEDFTGIFGFATCQIDMSHSHDSNCGAAMTNEFRLNREVKFNGSFFPEYRVQSFMASGSISCTSVQQAEKGLTRELENISFEVQLAFCFLSRNMTVCVEGIRAVDGQ